MMSRLSTLFVLFTLAGVGIAWIVMVLADRLQRTSATHATA